MKVVSKQLDLSPKALDLANAIENPQSTEDEIFLLNEDVWKGLDDETLTQREHSFLVRKILERLLEFEFQRKSSLSSLEAAESQEDAE